jgi:long-subunit fatty acid transport protein
MGGAFIGVADDATAAYTNPAGLTILTRPEMSLEFKYTNNTNRVYDSKGGDTYTDYDDETTGASFLSAVFPRENATIAIYRQQFINTDLDFRFAQAGNKVDLNGNIYGIGMGIKASDMASVGFSVGFAQLDYFFEARKGDVNNPDPGERPFIHQVDGEDSSEYYSASLLLSPVESLSLGMVYRYGPEFDTRMNLTETTGTISNPNSPPATLPLFNLYNLPNHMKVPDVYGVGLSWRPLASLTIAADYNRIKYSQLADGLVVLPIHSGATTDDFHIDDADEYHAGLEYVLDLGGFPLALRAGYYFRPDHRFYYTGNNPDTRNMYHPGEDEDIYSGGFGMVLGEKVQLDAAAMIGDFTEEYTMSMVYRY